MTRRFIKFMLILRTLWFWECWHGEMDIPVVIWCYELLSIALHGLFEIRGTVDGALIRWVLLGSALPLLFLDFIRWVLLSQHSTLVVLWVYYYFSLLFSPNFGPFLLQWFFTKRLHPNFKMFPLAWNRALSFIFFYVYFLKYWTLKKYFTMKVNEQYIFSLHLIDLPHCQPRF